MSFLPPTRLPVRDVRPHGRGSYLFVSFSGSFSAGPRVVCACIGIGQVRNAAGVSYGQTLDSSYLETMLPTHHSSPPFSEVSFHVGFQQLTTCAVLDLGSADSSTCPSSHQTDPCSGTRVRRNWRELRSSCRPAHSCLTPPPLSCDWNAHGANPEC